MFNKDLIIIIVVATVVGTFTLKFNDMIIWWVKKNGEKK